MVVRPASSQSNGYFIRVNHVFNPFLVKVSEQEMDVIMTDPFKYVSDHVKRKIRNLEKRKEKLDGYKAKLAKGDKLNADQLDASNTIAHFLAFSNVFSRKIRRSNWHDHICE